MLVAEQDGAIVGGALAVLAGDSVKVDVIALESQVRRQGIGRQLIELIEAEAIRVGARAIHLGGATVENRGFYRRLGFVGRGSMMQKGLPLAGRYASERLRRVATGSNSSSTTPA
jgi:GNAT superfamily N-acetyltransferase